MLNPLLDFRTLPRFDKIKPEHAASAIRQVLEQTEILVEQLASSTDETSWDSFVQPLVDGLEPVSHVWGIIGHLHTVNDTTDWRKVYNELLPEVTRFYTRIGQDKRLFVKYKAIADSPEYRKLSSARKKIIDNELLEFRLSGAQLPEEGKPRFEDVCENLSKLSSRFSENLLDATNAFSKIIEEESKMAGLPESIQAAAAHAAKEAGVTGWMYTLQAPSYLPIMQYAEDRELRAEMYRAYSIRAAEFDDCGSEENWNNMPLICDILSLRAEKADMLGFDSYAVYSLADKMADSPEAVLDFLHDLVHQVKPHAEQDINMLRQFAKTELGLADLQAWDVSFVAEKLRQARYDFSEQQVKEYFTEPKVLSGLFDVVYHLFGVQFSIEPDAAVWHPDVRLYRLHTSSGNLIGHLYMDLYARTEKSGGAWMNDVRGRRTLTQHDGAIQTPIAYICCNFSSPPSESAATFSHDEVQTLFHEVGHALHHLLTRQTDLSISGLNGVEWDAVELPSQFMENYCWEWSVVQKMSAHVKTEEPLPESLFKKMLQAKNFLSGIAFARQLEFSLFDLRLHSELNVWKTEIEARQVMEVLNQARLKVAALTPPAWNRFANGFSHIFSGGYAAGYYSYKWAEVLSSDVYAAFEETGDPFDASTGQHFLDEMLAIGGARSAKENFLVFRGRPPRVDALLRHNGMVA